MFSVQEKFLSPLSFLFRSVVRARQELYERNIFKSQRLGGFTISVGNITVGGTGKTPLVAYIAEILAAEGEKVCVLTRGYGRENPRRRILVSDGEKILTDDAKQAGDEPLELARKLVGAAAAVVADADRLAAARWARENLGATVFVLDDAFQHRRARRDLDIVCIDAANPFGNGKVLPAGILREPLSGLRRADVVVITRANLVDEKKVSDLKFQISDLSPGAKIFVSRSRITKLTPLEEFNGKLRENEKAREKVAATGNLKAESGQERKTKTENQKTIDRRPPTADSYLVFCALGNPENFFAQLSQENFSLAATKPFRDHHRYRQKDVDELESEAARGGAKGFITTAKDAVKLRGLNFSRKCFVAESEMIFDDEKGFEEVIKNYKLA
jgi:tetraacyldisaccharide 4'-kinase